MCTEWCLGMVKVSLKINSSPCEIKFSFPWKIIEQSNADISWWHFLVDARFLNNNTSLPIMGLYNGYNSFNICEIYICLFTPLGNNFLCDNISNRRYRKYVIKEFKMVRKLRSRSCKEAGDFQKYFDWLRLYWIENGISSFCDNRYLNTILRIKKHSINV